MRCLTYVVGVGLAAVSAATAVAEEAGPPPSFFVGRYEIVGRSPGAGGQPYAGWAEISLDGEELTIVRCVGGREVRGKLAFGSATADRVRVVRARFTLGDQSLEATCQIHIDLDNYPRLTCLTYPTTQPAIETPGVEALFHAKWLDRGSGKGCR